MNIFPTQYSTLSSSALKDNLEQRYGFHHMSCRLLIRNVSDTYLLENQEAKYIFKIYRDSHRKIQEIKAEVELLNFLKGSGARVAYPIVDLQGEQIQSFQAAEGIRNGVLFSFAAGSVIQDLNEQQLIMVGKEMAFIHNLTSRIELQHSRKAYTIATTLAEPLQTIKPAFEYMREEYAYLTHIAEKVIKKLHELDTDNFSYGYCHYDFLPKNFHIDEKQEVTFFDFDFAGKGYLVNDLMTLFVHFFLHVHYYKLTQQQAESDFNTFLKGYRQLKAVSDQEIAAIPYLGVMFWVFYLGFQYENFDDWSNIFFTPKFIQERVALIQKWTEMYCRF